jgi:hypothetical protein
MYPNDKVKCNIVKMEFMKIRLKRIHIITSLGNVLVMPVTIIFKFLSGLESLEDFQYFDLMLIQ